MGRYSEEYFESADGLRLHYRDYPGSPDRPPVFCLPGLTRNCRDFESIALHLSPRYRVISPDFRGRGLSEHDPEWRNYHPMTYVGDMEKLADQLGFGKIICLGTSLGGLVSTILNHRRPERVDRIMLNDIGPEIAPEGLKRVMSYAGLSPPVSSWEEAVQQAKDTYGLAFPDLSDEDWLAWARAGFREDEDGVPQLDIDRRIGDAIRQVGARLDDPWEMFAAMKDKPVLVIHGVLSDILTTGIIDRMRAIKPDLDVLSVPNRGHVPLLNESECIAGIDAFLQRAT